MRKPFLATILTLTVLIAGCHAPDEPADPNTGGNTGGDSTGGDSMEPVTLTLTVVGFPESPAVGTPFSVNVTVEASRATTSMHSGFHYGMNSSASADPGNYSKVLNLVSPHVTTETAYPGSYMVTGWEIPAGHEGHTMYARAHVLDADHKSHWGAEFTFTVAS